MHTSVYYRVLTLSPSPNRNDLAFNLYGYFFVAMNNVFTCSNGECVRICTHICTVHAHTYACIKHIICTCTYVHTPLILMYMDCTICICMRYMSYILYTTYLLRCVQYVRYGNMVSVCSFLYCMSCTCVCLHL